MAASQTDREDNTPFLLRLFCRQGSFHRPEEFASRSLQPSVSVYTWPSCSLNELACQIASERPSLLPSPSIGTRVAFRLVYPDTRSLPTSNHGQPRFMVKDIGSVVIGDGIPGASNSALGDRDPDADDDVEMGGRSPVVEGAAIGDSTLQDARYVVGDFVSCAILPPLSDGSVAPESAARRERPGPAVPSGGFGGPRRDPGFGRGDARGGRRRGFGDVPSGDWRRGERLPDEPPSRPGGRGNRRWR